MIKEHNNPCYFCRSDEAYIDRVGRYGCPICSKEYPGVNWSLTTYDNEGLLFAHIYLNETEVTSVTDHNFIVKPRRWYHVRLHLREDYTIVRDADDINHKVDLLKLPGHPITPVNAKEKVKLYLLFS